MNYLSPRLLCIPVSLALLAGCQSTSDRTRTAHSASNAGSALRTAPGEGTRYLTSVGLPDAGPILLPDWVVNPTLDGVLGSVGVAGPNDLGTTHQIDNARTSARLEIARMLEVRVQDVGRRDIEQYLRAQGDGAIGNESSRKSLLGVDRTITDSVLSGSRQRALWFDPSSGDCYVWMVMDGAVQTRANHYVENGVSVYVANQPITKEFRPEHPKPPAPAPVVEEKQPEPIKGPIEQLEGRLKPIEAIPIKAKPETK